MICAARSYLPENIFLLWGFATFLAAISITVLSGTVFLWAYVNPSYEVWQKKSNAVYPDALTVRDEYLKSVWGAVFVTLHPTILFFVMRKGWSQAYCGLDEYPLWWTIGQIFVIIGIVDFYEFFYHWCGHKFDLGWMIHKHHHVFHNPSPFAVIADKPMDNFMRSLPLLLIPLLMPTNMDIIFYTFTAFFYAYGVYLHSGIELDILPSDHKYINTSFQHYIHHATSGRSNPVHCGFFIKLWDQIWDIEYKGKPVFARDCVARGERTREAYEKMLTTKPKYHELLSPLFWISPSMHKKYKSA